jgi:hypothetical protein
LLVCSWLLLLPCVEKRHHRSSSLSHVSVCGWSSGCWWPKLNVGGQSDPHPSRRGPCGGHPDLPSCPTSCSVMRTRRRCRCDMATGLWWYASAADVVLPHREAEPPTPLLALSSVTTSRRRVSPRRHHVPLTNTARACASGGGWWAWTTGQGPMRTCSVEVGLDPCGLGDGSARRCQWNR